MVSTFVTGGCTNALATQISFVTNATVNYAIAGAIVNGVWEGATGGDFGAGARSGFLTSFFGKQWGVKNLKNPYRFVVAGFNGGINSMCHGGSFKNGFATAFGMSFVGDIVDGAEKTYAGTTTTSQQTHDDPSTLEVMNYGNQLYTQLGETTPGIDPDAIEMYEDLMADPAFLYASNNPGGAIPEALCIKWHEWQDYVGKVYGDLTRGKLDGSHIIDWVLNKNGTIERALEAKYCRIINNTQQLREFARGYGKKFELWICGYTQKISPTLVKTINDSGGNIMRVINGVPRKVDLDALIKAGGVFDQLNIFDWMPYPMYIDPYANRNMI